MMPLPDATALADKLCFVIAAVVCIFVVLSVLVAVRRALGCGRRRPKPFPETRPRRKS
jgi:hypothetical protein